MDGGRFVELAVRLAQPGGFKRVIYYCDLTGGDPDMKTAVIGDGLLDNLDVTLEFEDLAPYADVFVFPDSTRPDWQTALRKHKKPVWGSGEGCRLEWNRQDFLRKLGQVKLPVPAHKVCHGLAELRAYLADREDQYIKTSRFRANGETWHWVDADLSSGELDALAVEYGPLQNHVDFIAFPSIDAVSEWGYDGYFVNGKFPTHSLHGVEAKDKSYFGAFTAFADLPGPIRHVQECMRPLLERVKYANFWSAECRITEDGMTYFTDPTARHASPAGEAQLECYENLPEIVFEGAHGTLVNPKPAAAFVAQAMITHHKDYKEWRVLWVPDEVRRFTKLTNVTRPDPGEIYAFPPLAHSCDSVGSLLGLGDTPQAALDHLKENAEAFAGQPVSVEVESIADIIKELEEAKEQGIELTPQKLPEPAEALM